MWLCHSIVILHSGLFFFHQIFVCSEFRICVVDVCIYITLSNWLICKRLFIMNRRAVAHTKTLVVSVHMRFLCYSCLCFIFGVVVIVCECLFCVVYGSVVGIPIEAKYVSNMRNLYKITC